MDQNLTGADYQELAEFRYRLRKFLRFSEEAAVSVGITPAQHQLLLSIAGAANHGCLTPKEIAEHLIVRAHSALGLIQRCEKLQLVQRFNHAKDRRSICIELTDKGKSILDELTVRHQAELKRLGLSYTNFMVSDVLAE